MLHIMGTACIPIPPSLRGINYTLHATALGKLIQFSDDATHPLNPGVSGGLVAAPALILQA